MRTATSDALKNVIFLNDFASVNGGATQVALTSASLLARHTDLNVYFISSVTPAEAGLVNGIELLSLGHGDIGNDRSLLSALKGIYNPRSADQLSHILKGFNPSNTVIVVHSWVKSLSSSVFRELNTHKFPVYVTLHDYFLACPNGAQFNYQRMQVCLKRPMSLSCVLSNCDKQGVFVKWYRVLKLLITRWMFSRKYRLLFVSEFSRKKHLSLDPSIRRNPSFVIPNPIPEYLIDSCSTNDYTEGDSFLFVGRLESEKGIHVLRSLSLNAGVSITVVGDGPLLRDLDSLEKVNCVGWQADIRPFLKRARGLIFPSVVYETMGLTVTEALRFGVPVFVAQHTAAADLVKPGVNGELFDVFDLSATLDRFSEFDAKIGFGAYPMSYEREQFANINDNHLLALCNAIGYEPSSKAE